MQHALCENTATYRAIFSPVIEVLLKDDGDIFSRHVDNMLIRSSAVATWALHQLTVSSTCSTIGKEMDNRQVT